MAIYSKQEIIDIVTRRCYINKTVTYEMFKELYNELGSGIEEPYFAEILGISYSNYRSFKQGRNKATILKKYTIEDVISEKIKNQIIQLGYKNKKIDYEEFKNLYNIYGHNMKEYQFAQILNITYANYNNMKNKGTRANVLKDKLLELTTEEKKLIIQQIKDLGYKNNDSINYEKFLVLYEMFEDRMKEKDFAQVLGINYSNYNDMKKQRTNARILKNKEELTEEEKENIRKRIILDGYENKYISYQEFQTLKNTYANEISETEFTKVLNIKYNNFHSMKSNKGKTKILKRMITPEEQIQIKDDLVKNGYLGKSINYEEFIDLYNKYAKGDDETNFAKILEISYSSYNNIKNKNVKSKILKKYVTNEETLEKWDYIEVLKNCYQNGDDKKKAIKYIKNIFGVTNKQILKKINEYLKNKEENIDER